MIYAEMEKLAQQHGDREIVVTTGGRYTLGQLRAETRRLAEAWRNMAGRRIGVCVGDVGRMFAALAALDKVGATAVLSRADQPRHAAHELATAGCEAVIRDGEDIAQIELEVDTSKDHAAIERHQPSGQSEVVLFTSGTSGSPKPAVHTWKSLCAAVRRGDQQQPGRRWLLTYPPSSFAGLQVLLQAVLSGGTVVVPEGAMKVAACLERERVDMVSATPTFWRNLLWTTEPEVLARLPIRQVTLGGEAADQPLLDALCDLFPKARVSHVYASTEMGVCFAVHDGQAGFPAQWLEAAARPCGLRIAGDGELLVRSSRRMQRYDGEAASGEEWFATGDLFRRAGDRIVFFGRKGDTIHVGGSKVQPCDVEAVIRRCAGVREVRVYGVGSSVTGQLVAAEIWTDGQVAESDVRQDIHTHCRGKLPKHAHPAIVTISSADNRVPHKLPRQAVSVGG